MQYTLYVYDDPYVPNAISPNGDGKNDFLKIPFLSGYPENQVYIYNRWGRKVYEATNYKDDWGAKDCLREPISTLLLHQHSTKPLKGSLTVFMKTKISSIRKGQFD
ncbi:MAG: gliding motility-associated C-terminal domain-containing protein [Bacteroidia bacterium]